MDWIQILFVVAGVIAYWLNQRAREKEEAANQANDDASDRRDLAPASRDGTDPEQDDRTRRIQEEIRRKIAERRGQAAPPPMPVEERGEPVFRAPVVPPPPVRHVEVPAYDDSAALDRQRKLAVQMERLEAQRRETRRLAERAQANARSAASAAVASLRSRDALPALAAELRDPRALRRAVMLREVLDTPVALR